MASESQSDDGGWYTDLGSRHESASDPHAPAECADAVGVQPHCLNTHLMRDSLAKGNEKGSAPPTSLEVGGAEGITLVTSPWGRGGATSDRSRA
jgi:hypothetical protein